MTTSVKVFPMSKNALNIIHPETGYKLSADGSTWPEDGFTARMLSDGEVTTDESKAWKE